MSTFVFNIILEIYYILRYSFFALYLLPPRVESKIDKFEPAASAVSVHNLKLIAGLVGPIFKVTGRGIKFICDVWYFGGTLKPDLSYIRSNNNCSTKLYIADKTCETHSLTYYNYIIFAE